MKEDIKEIQSIIRELQELRPAQHENIIEAAIQIQRNRILKDALFELHSDGRGGFHHLSNLQKIAENS